MSRSILILLGLGLVASPALAQQPLQPAYPPNDSQYGAQPAQPQYDPAQPQSQYAQQPVDPYAAYGDSRVEDDDEDDDGYDVTYDISTSDDQQYDDGYDPNAYQQFESALSPYGTWEDVPSYGHVWVPSSTEVGYDFTPYASGGNWVNSDYGWTWVSDYGWGWAPFHYGRWLVVGGRGWCWVPGTTWGPGWVSWRWGGGYVGWAPMGPRGVVIGPPRGVRSPWHFTTAAQLGTAHPRYLPSRAVAGVWGHTATVNNVSHVAIGGTQVRFNAGPPANVVAATVGHPIASVSLRSFAPRALPRATITPRVGVPLQQRPWMQSRPIGGTFAHQVPGAHTLGQPTTVPRSTTLQARPMPLSYRSPQAMTSYRPPVQQYHAFPQTAYHGYTQPAYRAPAAQPYHAPAAMTPYHAAPVYSTPHYNAPTYSAAPRYSAPAYSAPRYSAPVYSAPHYSAPAYSAPHYSAPAYSAPSYSAPHMSAPTYSAPATHSAPSSFGGYHASGGGGGGAAHFGGFHGGGRR
jgi:hypothetical protein